jgi:hypothetical protein
MRPVAMDRVIARYQMHLTHRRIVGRGANSMIISDNCGTYTVRLDYSHTTAEIVDTDSGESIVFMQGDEAESFASEYARIPDGFMSAFLSDYDYRAEQRA